MHSSRFVRHVSAIRLLRAVPTVLLLALGLAVAWAVASPVLTRTHGFGLSLPRLFVLGGLGGVVIYLLYSLTKPRLLRLNTLVALNATLSLAGSELVIRLLSDRLPVSVVALLPTEVRSTLLEQRGLFTPGTLTGSGLLYSWKPRFQPANLPWLTVDDRGYRNPSPNPDSTDVVLLGDSVTISQNSPVDLGALLREAGYTALNLSFSGYGPAHERDAYQRFVLAPKVSHRVVVINFCMCNDLSDAISYRDLLAQGRTWQDYLGTSPARTAFPFGFSPPWIVSILFNLPYVVTNWLRQSLSGGNSNLVLDLPRGSVTIGANLVGLVAEASAPQSWLVATDALGEIIRMARAAGARPLLTYYPSAGQLYGPWLDERRRQGVEREYVDAVARLSKFALENEAEFIDYTPSLRSEIGTTMITQEDGDYHPNELGVRFMASILMPAIRKAMPHS